MIKGWGEVRRAPPLKRHLAFINKLSKGDALFLRATRTGCRPNDRLGGTAAGRADLESLDPVNNRVASGTLGAGLNPLRTTNDLILSKLGRGFYCPYDRGNLNRISVGRVPAQMNIKKVPS